MNFKNANIGVALGLALYAIGSFLTDGAPNGLEAIAITVVSLGAAFGLCDYLNARDRRLGRPLPPSLFRRSESDGEGPG